MENGIAVYVFDRDVLHIFDGDDRAAGAGLIENLPKIVLKPERIPILFDRQRISAFTAIDEGDIWTRVDFIDYRVIPSTGIDGNGISSDTIRNPAGWAKVQKDDYRKEPSRFLENCFSAPN